MRPLGIFFGAKAGVGVIVLLSMFPMGIAHGAAAVDDVYIDADEMHMTASEIEDREPPWHIQLLEKHLPEQFNFDGEPDPRVQGAVVRFTNNLLDVAVWMFNAGSGIGHANANWISPVWAVRMSQVVILAGLGGYLLSMGHLVRGEIA